MSYEVQGRSRMTIEDVLDREEIRAVLMRYVRGIDRRDVDLVKSVYWPDATDDHTIFSGNALEFADFIMDYYKDYVITIHNIGSIIIEVNGPRARVESYYTYFHRRPEGGDFVDLLTSGRYMDKFEKRDGEWRIADRTVSVDWSAGEEKWSEWEDGVIVQFPRGGNYPGDRIYTWLGAKGGREV